MAKQSGKAFRIKFATTAGGTYTASLGINAGTINLSGTTLDVSEFGDTWMERIQGLKDASYDLKGFYNAADTTGQNVVMTSFMNDSALHAEFLPDGTTGFKQPVIVSKFSIDEAVNGVCGVSITLEGNGTATQI